MCQIIMYDQSVLVQRMSRGQEKKIQIPPMKNKQVSWRLCGVAAVSCPCSGGLKVRLHRGAAGEH